MTETTAPGHWDDAYAKGDTTRSWYQQEATESLRFITTAGLPGTAAIVDIGGGASPLVDGLLDRGFADITIIDLSTEGLDIARARLGDRADTVTWTTADVLTWQPARTFDLWHDRAVLHFLTTDEDRATYANRAASLVTPGGWITIGGFAPDGPTSCSGLPVRGASSDELAELFAHDFTTTLSAHVTHTTPSGNHQAFAWLIAQRR